MDIKISVIVPVYNVSKYLRRALESAVNQTFKDIEVLVVNDGSPDPMDAEIMGEYAERYPDIIKLFFHEKNLGLSCARNTGIRAARGEYVLFLDSDDEYTLDACEKYYECAKITGADVVRSDAFRPNFYNGLIKYQYVAKKSNRYDIKDDILYINHSVWSTLISKKLLLENDLYFIEGIFIEDAPFTFMLNLLANKTAKIDEPLYIWYDNENSILNNFSLDYVKDVLHSCHLIRTSPKELPDYERIKNYAEIRSFCWIDMGKFNYIWHKCFDALRSFVKYSEVDIDNPLFYRTYKKRGYDLVKALKSGEADEISLEKYADVNYIKTELAIFLNDKYNKRITIWGFGKYGRAIFEVVKEYAATNSLTYHITDSNDSSHGLVIDEKHTIRDFSELRDITDIIILAFKDTPTTLVKNSSEILTSINLNRNKYEFFNINDYI